MNGFPSDLFAGSRFAVLGLGKNGWPAAQALAAMGAEVIAWDDRQTPPPLAGGDRAAKRIDGEGSLEIKDFAAVPFNFDALILSPGIPHTLPKPHPVALRAREAGVPILSDAELLFQAVRRAGSRARFIGVTGTNGKSTTTALTAHILSTSWPGQTWPSTSLTDQASGAAPPVAAGANLGPAALALPLLPDNGFYVLEMSSYMLERLATLRFDAAAMLNLSPDHIDRHGDMAGYASAKRAIFDRQTAGDLAVIGTDDAPSREMAEWLRTRPARITPISGPASTHLVANAPALPGAHNAQNAAAALAITEWLGLPHDAIMPAIATFPGLPHRQQRIATIDGTTFINDSKATNADAAARALGCYDRVIWIAGGIAKEGGIVPLAPLFPRIAKALLIGRDAPAFAATLARHGVPHEVAGTLEAAVPAAFAIARAASTPVVLLSPACASFDQFSGFDARGDRFAALVRALPPPLAGGRAPSPPPLAGGLPSGRPEAGPEGGWGEGSSPEKAA